MVSIVIISESVKEKIKQVIEYANENVTSLETLKKVAIGEANPVGDSEEYTVRIPNGIKAVFSIEEQAKPIGLCKHLSVSINLDGRTPHPGVVTMIMQEFGFKNDLDRCIVWNEDFGDGTLSAINVIEPIDGIWDEEFLFRLKELKKQEKERNANSESAS